MPKFRYELSLEQVKSLAVFLNRVELKGSEVPVFTEIITALGNPVSKSEPEKVSKTITPLPNNDYVKKTPRPSKKK